MTRSSLHQRFSLPLLNWYDQHGRKDLPWQHPRSAYRVWVSEIMLQQTQVKTVIPYFNRFMVRFPDVLALALASIDEVLAHWSGLGYYSRARNLHKTASIIHQDFDGQFPYEILQLQRFPGIGPSTAAAIASLAFDLPAAILDGNAKRVFSRYFLIGEPGQKSSGEQALWKLAQDCMPPTRCADFTQAIMDFGALFCTTKTPQCTQCPLQSTCLAKQNNAVSNYPPKPLPKKRPTTHQQFILLHTDNNRIYLEKRPDHGVWGGLWCLPSIASHLCATSFIQATYRLNPKQQRELISMKHAFSHFNLHIQALSMLISLSETPSHMPGQWFSPHDINKVGLAKPVSTIIEHFLKE